MNSKIFISVLTSVFLISILIGCVSANYYYEYADPWYGNEYVDMTP